MSPHCLMGSRLIRGWLHQLLQSFRISKETRALGVLEDKSFTREGQDFHNHIVRRCEAQQGTFCKF